MYEYEMDPIRTVGTTEQIWDVGPTDKQTDRWMDGWSDTNKPPNIFIVGGV